MPDCDKLGQAAVHYVDLVAENDSLDDAFSVQGHSDAKVMDWRVGGETVRTGLDCQDPIAAQAPEGHSAGLDQSRDRLGQSPEEDRKIDAGFRVRGNRTQCHESGNLGFFEPLRRPRPGLGAWLLSVRATIRR
jgi:hypothetical protein